MASNLNSFDESELKAFTQSTLNARNGGSSNSSFTGLWTIGRYITGTGIYGLDSSLNVISGLDVENDIDGIGGDRIFCYTTRQSSFSQTQLRKYDSNLGLVNQVTVSDPIRYRGIGGNSNIIWAIGLNGSGQFKKVCQLSVIDFSEIRSQDISIFLRDIGGDENVIWAIGGNSPNFFVYKINPLDFSIISTFPIPFAATQLGGCGGNLNSLFVKVKHPVLYPTGALVEMSVLDGSVIRVNSTNQVGYSDVSFGGVGG